MNERIKKISESIPQKMFFDPSFESLSRSNLLVDVTLREGKSFTRDQEYQIFRKYNYLKYRLMKLTVGFKETEEVPAPKPCPPVRLNRLGEKSVLELESLVARIAEIRNYIIQANSRIVFRPVNRHFPSDSFERDEFVSNSYLHLIKAIDCFDYRRGFKFSTYCITAIKMNLIRDMKNLKKTQNPLDFSDSLQHVCKSDDSCFIKEDEEYTTVMLAKVFSKIRDHFHDSERKIEILKNYYGIGCSSMLAKDIGEKMKLTRQRISKIKADAESFVAKSLSYNP